MLDEQQGNGFGGRENGRKHQAEGKMCAIMIGASAKSLCRLDVQLTMVGLCLFSLVLGRVFDCGSSNLNSESFQRTGFHLDG